MSDYILLFIHFRIALGSGWRLGATNKKRRQDKWVMIHKFSLCEFHIKFKFVMKEKIVEVWIMKMLWGDGSTEI